MKLYFLKQLDGMDKTGHVLRVASGWLILLGIGVMYRSILIISKGATSSDTINGVVGLIIGAYLVVYYGGIYVTLVKTGRRD